MTPDEFREKWRKTALSESAASKEHFLDLCALLGIKPPAEADPYGENFTFEKSVLKLDGRPGRADVWKRGCFAWEYKGNKKNLVAAYSQLKEYADALENPPLLIVSDMKEIRVHTNFTNAVVTTHVIQLADLNDPKFLQLLRWAFTDPEKLRPTLTREAVTEDAARAFAVIAQNLRAKGVEPRRVAHFLNKLLFCLFAEDIDLLPGRVFADIVEESTKRAEDFVPMLTDLFRAMRDDKGRFGTIAIPWFNGGLFDDDDVLPLSHFEIIDLAKAARLDWSAIEPSIFGTLFERGLDPARRKEMAGLFDGAIPKTVAEPKLAFSSKKSEGPGVGVHYTDPATIMKIIEPVVLRPLRAEWHAVKEEVAKAKLSERAKLYLDFRTRLGRVRVLDPACGSGNFLYLALQHLKDFDLRVAKEAVAMGLPQDEQRITPDTLLGIEINPYAAELARLTIWIGEIQWQMKNALGIKRRPILGPLGNIERRDALIQSGSWEAAWPDAEFIVGNPPFLGDKKMKGVLGEDYVKRLRKAFDGRLPKGVDLVCYWFEKARAVIGSGRTKRVGLVATNSIRGGANRKALDRICTDATIFEAWSDEPWVLEGAAVRVSLICFKHNSSNETARLNGGDVLEVFSDLTARTSHNTADLTLASPLRENRNTAFNGIQKTGPFEVPGKLARDWLVNSHNPHNRHNSDVLKPYWNGIDITRRPRESWIIDFGFEKSEADAALYELPFQHALKVVKPVRDENPLKPLRELWWRHWRPRPEMQMKISKLRRYIVTPEVSKHRIFHWSYWPILADKNLIVIAREDNTTFGVLHSRFHELWALRKGTSLEDRPRYTPSSTFETFPFPEGLTPDIPARKYAKDKRAMAIADIAKRLNELRENWLNPPDLARREPEVISGYPDRLVPRGEAAEKELRKRTLTNLYNQKPQWLQNAHRELDEAVAKAYGWSPDLTDDEVLAKLLALNLERAATEKA